MRFFFALTFNDKAKRYLMDYQKKLRKHAIKGRNTRGQNLHVTLAFIGESSQEQKNKLIEILHQLTPDCDHLVVDRLGSFCQKSGRLVWMGISKTQELMELHSNLQKKLTESSFVTESQKYLPHITLARHIYGNIKLEKIHIDPYLIDVRSIALLESKFIDGRLVYQIIDEIPCGI